MIYIIIPLLLLEEFIKRILIGIYKVYISIDNWNFNRTLNKRNQQLYDRDSRC
jgi:hypothetical protein